MKEVSEQSALDLELDKFLILEIVWISTETGKLAKQNDVEMFQDVSVQFASSLLLAWHIVGTRLDCDK